MIAYAAIDLRQGRTVQLVGGRTDAEQVSDPDPLAVTRRWLAAGFHGLHVVDLDAALGEGSNAEVVADILAEARAVAADGPSDAAEAGPRRDAASPTRPTVNVGGGVRERQDVAALVEAGADRVVVGTRAVEEPDWLAEVAAAWPGRLIVAADVRGDRVAVSGWTRTTELSVARLLRRIEELPLAAVLVTDVEREGRMGGIDADRFGELVGATRHPLIAAGGVGSAADLAALAAAGVAGAVLGMSLYTGRIDPQRIAREYAS